MNLDLIFPVPILVHDVDAGVREATRAKVQAYMATEAGKRDIAPSPVEAVDTSYYNTQRSVLDDARLDELKREVLAAGAAFVHSLRISTVTLEVERSWINVFRPNAQEMEHSHDGSLFSGAYYVEAPERCGDLYFPDPIGARRVHRAFTNTAGTDPQNTTQWCYTPKAGRLVMFEAWTPHGVLSNKSGQNRISISFNLRQRRP